MATQLTRPDEKHRTMCGTPNFISPEVATRGSHGLEVDVWGLGCLLYTLLVGSPPFDTNGVKSTLTRVVMATYSLPGHLSPEAKDLINALLQKNPKDRISLDQILDHPFIKRSFVSSHFVFGRKRKKNLYQVHSTNLTQDSGIYTMSSRRESETQGFSRKASSDCCPMEVPYFSHPKRMTQSMEQAQQRCQYSSEDCYIPAVLSGCDLAGSRCSYQDRPVLSQCSGRSYRPNDPGGGGK